jgi:hypothetical protein
MQRATKLSVTGRARSVTRTATVFCTSSGNAYFEVFNDVVIGSLGVIPQPLRTSSPTSTPYVDTFRDTVSAA